MQMAQAACKKRTLSFPGDLMDILIRFVIGGTVVSLFAVIGDLIRPRSFAGLFGAAPSVALASLGLTILLKGAGRASTECRSMLIGAIALGVYCAAVCWLLMRTRRSPLPATVYAMVAWFAVAFGLWALLLR